MVKTYLKVFFKNSNLFQLKENKLYNIPQRPTKVLRGVGVDPAPRRVHHAGFAIRIEVTGKVTVSVTVWAQDSLLCKSKCRRRISFIASVETTV